MLFRSCQGQPRFKGKRCRLQLSTGVWQESVAQPRARQHHSPQTTRHSCAAAACFLFVHHMVHKRVRTWDFPGGPVVKTSPSNAGGAKIPHASQPKKQNIKQKQNCNKFNKDFKNGPHQKSKNSQSHKVFPGGKV